MALTADDTRKRLSAIGIEVPADGATALADRIAREAAMWAPVVAKGGIKAE